MGQDAGLMQFSGTRMTPHHRIGYPDLCRPVREQVLAAEALNVQIVESADYQSARVEFSSDVSIFGN